MSYQCVTVASLCFIAKTALYGQIWIFVQYKSWSLYQTMYILTRYTLPFSLGGPKTVIYSVTSVSLWLDATKTKETLCTVKFEFLSSTISWSLYRNQVYIDEIYTPFFAGGSIMTVIDWVTSMSLLLDATKTKETLCTVKLEFKSSTNFRSIYQIKYILTRHTLSFFAGGSKNWSFDELPVCHWGFMPRKLKRIPSVRSNPRIFVQDKSWSLYQIKYIGD